MKWILSVSVAVAMVCPLNGQQHERKILVFANGAYSQHLNDRYDGPSSLSAELRGGKFSVGIYGKVNSFFYAGIGLGYETRMEYKEDAIDNLSGPSENYAFLRHNSKSEVTCIYPALNFKLFKTIGDRFYIGLNILTGYKFTETTDESYAIIHVSNSDTSPFIMNVYNSNISDKQGISLALQPELTYYLTSWMGISAGINFYTYDAVNASQFFFARCSNDIMWSVGVVFPIN